MPLLREENRDVETPRLGEFAPLSTDRKLQLIERAKAERQDRQPSGLSVARRLEILNRVKAERPIEKRPSALGFATRAFGEELRMGYGVPEERPMPETVTEKVAAGAGALAGMLPSFAAMSLVTSPIVSAALKVGRVGKLMKTLHGIGKVVNIAKKGEKARYVTKLGQAVEGATRSGALFAAHGAAHALPPGEEGLTARLKAGAKAVPMGMAFGGTAPLVTSKLGHMAMSGALGGGITTVEGGSTEDILIQGGLLAAMSGLHISIRDSRRFIKQAAKEIDKLPEKEQVSKIKEALEPVEEQRRAELTETRKRQVEIDRAWVEKEEAYRRTPEGRQELIEEIMPEKTEAPMTTISEETTAIAKAGMRPGPAERRIAAFGRIPERGVVIGEERLPEREIVTPEERPISEIRVEEDLMSALATPAHRRTAEEVALIKRHERIEDIIEPRPFDRGPVIRALGMQPRRVEPAPIEPTTEIAREPAAEITRKPIEIPEFKNTKEARDFGEKATPEEIIELKRLREESIDEVKSLMETDPNAAMKLASGEAQFYREAVEASEVAVEPRPPKPPEVKPPEAVEPTIEREVIPEPIPKVEPLIKEAKSRIKTSTADILKGERGSFSTETKEGAATFEDFSIVGKDFIKRGADTFKKFTDQMKTTFGEVWENVKHLAEKMYTRSKSILADERGEITLREEVPEVKKLTIAERILGRVERPKRIKELDLGIEFKTDRARKVNSMYDRTDTELEVLRKPSLKKIYQKAKRATVDVSGNIKKELLDKSGQLGKEAVMHHDLIRGASAKTDKIVTEATDKIYKNLSKNEERLLDRIIQSRRIIAIEKYTKIKHPEGLGIKEHQEFLDSIPKDISTKLNKQADSYFSEMREQLKLLKKEGMLSKQDYENLLAKGDYSPRWFIQHIDPDRTYTFRGKKISVPDSGIKRLDIGSEQLLENNSRLMLASTTTRIQGRIFRNRANQALYKLAEQVPDNGVVSLAKIIRKTKTGKPVYQKAPGGFEKVSVMIDGEHREMLLPNEMAREWVESDPAMNAQMANIIGWVSGSKILKPMATGLNPEFALANLPRDVAHIWLTTEQYSPALYKALPQMGKDLTVTFSDAVKRKGAWLDYVDEGGGMNFLTHQGRIGKPGGRLEQMQKILGYIGETSEIWTRLALRNRAIRNGKSTTEATWIARNYLDFSQGGWLAKGADTAIPYLNAGIQGTRGVIKAAATNPKVFMQKMAQIGGLSVALYLANKFINPDCLDEIPDREKVNNFIITTPLSYRDKNGDKRYLYFKIAKDQGQRVVTTVFENLMAKYMGEDINITQISQAIQDFIPLMPDQATPPTWDAMMGYLANVDFWRREDIWKGPKVIPKEEFTLYTHPSFIEFGKATGLSPEKTRYALQQYFTYGNIYTSAVGAGFKLMTNQLSEDLKEKTTKEILKDMPFARRVLKATRPYTKYEKRIEEVKIEESTRRYKQNRELDKLSEQFYKKDISESKVTEFIKKQPKEDKLRLKRRFKRYGKLYEIPDKRWWLNIASMPPETRAVLYWNRFRDADKEEKERLSRYLRRVPGVTSKRFYTKLKRLQREIAVGKPIVAIPGMVPWKAKKKKRPAWQETVGVGKKPTWQKSAIF